MKRWYVVTPEYDTVEPILDDGTGPTERCADYIEIEATTAREAIMLGVTEMLKNNAHNEYGMPYHWCRNQQSDGYNPFSGVKAYSAGDEQVRPSP